MVRLPPVRLMPKPEYPGLPSGWKIIEDTPLIRESIIIQPKEFLYPVAGESVVTGDGMLKRVKTKAGELAGLRHLRRLLEYRELIPEEWKSAWIIFPGTIAEDNYGCRRVVYLRWTDKWCESWYSLDRNFTPKFQVAICET